MRAVVLVGGEGTRLRPLTLTTPKQMLPIGRRPMIERVLEHLHRHGVEQAVLSLGYRPDAFLAAYPDGTCAGVDLVYAVEPEPLDTAGAIRFAARFAGLDAGAEPFVVVNGDVLTTLDVSALVGFHRKRRALATIALTPVDDPSRFGVVATDETGRVLAFIEKPPVGAAPTNLINAGTYVLEPAVLDRIPGGRRVSIERETFPNLVVEGGLFALGSDAYWVDAGTPAAYLAANLDLVSGSGDPRVSNSIVGEQVQLGEQAVVEQSVLFDGVVVGNGAQVRSSIVGKAARVEDHAVVIDLSVVGDGAVVPAGTRLVGQRLPEPA
jgi:mannose-1-phosphate guanylyltransferase